MILVLPATKKRASFANLQDDKMMCHFEGVAEKKLSKFGYLVKWV